jgi:hypothetical protein
MLDAHCQEHTGMSVTCYDQTESYLIAFGSSWSKAKTGCNVRHRRYRGKRHRQSPPRANVRLISRHDH